MSQQPALLNEENIREVILTVIGFFLVALYRQIRKSVGGDDKVADLEEKVDLVLDSHQALIDRLLSDAEKRSIEAAEAIVQRERRISSLLAELEHKDRQVEKYAGKALVLLDKKEKDKTA